MDIEIVVVYDSRIRVYGYILYMIYIRALGPRGRLYKGPGKTYTTYVSLTG